jgi:hypothetical protein
MTLPLGPGLYSGFTGVAWATAHLTGRLLASDADDPNRAIDDTLLAYLHRTPWSHDYDLISGLVGYGVYALERLPCRTARAALEQIVARLAETAVHWAGEITWWTDPAWLPRETRERHPAGYYNLGLAHGVPGIIGLLGAVCAAGIAYAQARKLLDGAVAWLLAQHLPEETGASFAYWVEPGVTPTPARLAWCYGDAGVAAALLIAARCVGEPDWERAALEIALRAAVRPAAQAGVRDAGLCHGAAGLGQIFNRLYQATHDSRLATAARFWFEYALALRQPGSGIGGFRAWAPGTDGELGWVDAPGLLTGAAGIALALLGATTTIEPAWDRMLFLSIRSL